MSDYRNESRRQPPATKYGTPGTTYPTPNPYDLVITEDAGQRAGVFEPVLYGTPHPKVPAAVLCHQGAVKGNAHEKGYVRVYANPRLAQEPYNLINGEAEGNDKDYPVFVRSYLLPRGYAKATRGDPLKAVIGLTLGSGGTGYAAANVPAPGFGKVALSISGTGTGAAGFAECVAGVIVAVVLTNAGTGFTTAPTVTVSDGGGSGASITAVIQPQTAVLISEVESPAEEPYGGFFVRVTRTWDTLPGPVIKVKAGVDEMGNAISTTSQDALATAAASLTQSATQIQTYEGTDAVRGRILADTFPGSFAQVTEIDKVDAGVPGSRATVYTYLVTAASSIPADTATTTYERRKHPTNSALKMEIKTEYAIPADFDETDDNGHSFPEIYILVLADEVFGSYYNFRPGLSRIVPCQVAHSFGTSRITPVPTVIQEAEWRYPLGFSGHGLTNEEEIIFSKGGFTIVLALPASTPSSPTYLGWVADPSHNQLLIGGSSRIWRAGIYHTQKIYTDPL